MSEPCCKCESPKTGPEWNTPHGICAACACSACRGFRQRDDRGFPCTGQPYLTATDCTTCAGTGLRTKPPSTASVSDLTRKIREDQADLTREVTAIMVSRDEGCSSDATCVACGEETKHPPYCIECDMSGRSREHLATMAAHNPAEAARLRATRSNEALPLVACLGCGKDMAGQGADDDMPLHCDTCWAKVHRPGYTSPEQATPVIPDQIGLALRDERAARFLDECEDPRLCREIAQRQLGDEFINVFAEGMLFGLREGAKQRLEMAATIYEHEATSTPRYGREKK